MEFKVHLKDNQWLPLDAGELIAASDHSIDAFDYCIRDRLQIEEYLKKERRG